MRSRVHTSSAAAAPRTRRRLAESTHTRPRVAAGRLAGALRGHRTLGGCLRYGARVARNQRGHDQSRSHPIRVHAVTLLEEHAVQSHGAHHALSDDLRPLRADHRAFQQ